MISPFPPFFLQMMDPSLQSRGWLQWLPNLQQVHGKISITVNNNMSNDESMEPYLTVAKNENALILQVKQNMTRLEVARISLSAMDQTKQSNNENSGFFWILEDQSWRKENSEWTLRCRISLVDQNGDAVSILTPHPKIPDYHENMHHSLLATTDLMMPWYMAPEKWIIRGLSCSHCQHPVEFTQDQRMIQLLPLPSRYWHELVDCWICHPDDQQRHVPRWTPQMETDITKHALRRWYVDSTAIWVPSSLGSNEATENKQKMNTEITCVNCKQSIGQRKKQLHWPGEQQHQHQHDHTHATTSSSHSCSSSHCSKPSSSNQGSLASFDIYQLHAVRLSRVDGGVIINRFMDCILRQLHETTNAHAQSFFELSTDKGEERIWLWIMNWSVWMCSLEQSDKCLDFQPSTFILSVPCILTHL